MTAQLVDTIRTTVQPNDHPYMKGAWRPTYNEWNAVFANGEVEVIGTIPTDIDGVYVRTGENQILTNRSAAIIPLTVTGSSTLSRSRTAARAIAAALSAPRGSRPRRKPAARSGPG